MLDLSSIAFKVETKELDDAVSKLGDLQKAVSNLNKPLGKLSEATESAVKQTDKLAEAGEDAGKKLTAVERKLEQQATKMKVLRDETIQLTDGVEKLGKGFTSGQASQLATIKLLGATSEQVRALAKSFKDYNDITGVNTFDASANGLSRINKEIRELSQVNTLASKGLGLTREELKFLARDTNSLTQAFNAEGRSADELALAITRLNSEFVDASKVRNKLAAEAKAYEASILNEARSQAEAARLQQDSSEAMFRNHLARQEQIRKTHEQVMSEMRDYYKQEEKRSGTSATAQPSADAHVMRFYKQQEQAANSAAKATDYLTREMNRAENALAGLNNEVAISSSNRLLRFKESLIASGMATDVAAAKYQAYAKVIAETDKKRIAQQKSDEQSRINNLSRGLAPQISDVAVSLYGGMSPMTVLMQQGLQVRDLIQSSGVEAGKLSEVMRKTGADFVSTLTGTFKAVGSMVVGTLQSAGVNVTKFAMDATGAGLVLENFRYQATLASKDADSLTASLGKAALSFSNFVTSASSVLVGGGIAAGIVALVTAIAVIKQLIKEESELSKVLNLNGAALGLNRDAAYSLAATYAGARGDINGFADAISESAKAGNITSDSLQTVTQSAVYMKSVGGVAIADTVKQFSEIAKDPVKALEKLAISLGTIDPEILKVVRSLEEQGKQAQAASIATAAYAEGLAKAGAGIKNDMGFLESFFKTIGSAASSMWDKILNVGREGTLQQQIDSAKEKIRSLAAGEGVFILSDRNVVLGIEKAKLEGLEKQLAAQVALNNQKERNVALIKNDSEVNKLLDQYTEKSDKKKKAIEEVNNVFNESIRLAKEDGKAVAEIEANRAKALAGIEEKFKVRTKKDPQENYFANLMLEAGKATVKASDATDELTKSQERMLVLIQDSRFLALPKDKQALALASFASAAAQEAENKEWEAANKIMDETSKAMKQATIEADKLAKAREQRGISEVTNAQNKLALLDEELADMLLQKAIYGDLTAEQKKQIEYAKIQKEYKAEELRISKLLADPKNNIDEAKAQELRDINYLAAAKKRQNIDQAIILENNKYEYEQRVQLAAGISSSIEAALFEGGQAGSKKLREVIEAELRKPITLFIQAFVQDIFGLNGAGDTMSKAVSAFDKVLGFVNGGYASGLTKTGTSVVGSLVNNEVGAKLGLSYYDGTKYTTTGLGDTLGKTAGQVGGAMTAYGVQKTLSGGYKTGESGVVDALTAIGGFFDPTGGLIAGTIGAAVNRAFGRKLTETGIEGTFGGSEGFTGNQYSFEKGGWFRSDRTKTSALDSGIQEGFAGQFNVLRAGIALMSTSLGLGTKSIEDFTYKFKLNLMGLSEADATKKIKEEFDKVGVAIADTIPELKEYQKQGETNLETLTRLSTSLGTVNSTFELLGFKLEDLSLAGAKAADAIVTAYGSLEAFSSKMQAYYDAFYTEDEKKAKVLSSISAALKAAGVDVGDVSTLTRDGFRKIVDELVRTKGAADPAVVALLSVAPAFASVTKSTDEAVAAAKEAAEKLAKETADKAKEVADAAKKATDDAFSALQKAVSNQKDILSSQLNTAEALASNLDNIFELLKDNVRELYAEVTATSNMQVQQAYAIISNARTTGVLPSQDVLSQAIGTVRGSFDSNNYASKFEADRARLLLANDLAALQGIAGEQLTEAQQQIKLIKDQIEQYDLILENAEIQINELRGINTSVLSVTSAVDALTAALIAEQEANEATTAAATNPPQFVIGGSAPGQANARPPAASTLSRLGNTYYGSLNTAVTDTKLVDRYDSVNTYVNTLDWSSGNKGASSAALVAAARQYGLSSNDIAIATGYSRADIEALTGGQLPRFANGGYHSGGVRLVGENSPELEVTGPARYYNKDQFFDVLRSGFSGNNDNNESTEMLRAEVRAVAISTSKLQRIIDALVVPTNEGQALNVKVAV